jgi:AraC-like DNA-binding protein
MKYVEYFRILQAMEIISTTRLKKVYSEVGYKSTAVFSKAFIRATGFPPNCFYADEIEDYLYIIPSVCKIARNNPKEAIKFVLNYDNGSIRNILLAHQQRYKSIRD